MSAHPQRVTLKLKNPNPLFVKWLTEWHDAANEKDSKMKHCFKKALISMKKYPLPLDSGADCKILQGFGDTLCKMLDKKLREHNSSSAAIDLDATIGYHPTKKYINSQVLNPKPSAKKKQTAKAKKQKTTPGSDKVENYMPKYRSGGYAILLGMQNRSVAPGYGGFSNKSDIIKAAQSFCDKSFTKPDAGSYYTAWSSMKMLLSKGLVLKEGNPARFSLAEAGLAVAEKLKQSLENDDDDDHDEEVEEKDTLDSLSQAASSVNVTQSQTCSGGSSQAAAAARIPVEPETKSSVSSQTSGCTSSETVIFAPNSFEIVLLVDSQETTGKNDAADDELLVRLNREKVRYEVRHLKVGDYLWICRDAVCGAELVLPFIVERKRMDDLGASIKDGRFHEQKYRLRKSGIQNLVYLIESHGNNEHVGLPILTLYQAATNTLIQDGFSVKYTDCLNSTVHYLSIMSKILTSQYSSKTLMGCEKKNLEKHSISDDFVSLLEFKEFNKASSKSRNFKVQEFFVRQLLQLKGLSVEKALAIVKEYPTPFLLYASYEGCEQPEKMLASIRYGKLNKNIGPVISKCIYELYTKEVF